MLDAERSKERPSPRPRQRAPELELSLLEAFEMRHVRETEAAQPAVQITALEGLSEIVAFNPEMKVPGALPARHVQGSARRRDFRRVESGRRLQFLKRAIVRKDKRLPGLKRVGDVEAVETIADLRPRGAQGPGKSNDARCKTSFLRRVGDGGPLLTFQHRPDVACARDQSQPGCVKVASVIRGP